MAKWNHETELFEEEPIENPMAGDCYGPLDLASKNREERFRTQLLNAITSLTAAVRGVVEALDS